MWIKGKPRSLETRMKISATKKTFLSARDCLAKQRRFWKRIGVGELNECWPYLGAIEENGYPADRQYRLAYKQTFGSASKGEPLHHTCQNKICCNPTHTIPVTRKEHDLIHKSLKDRVEI